MRILCVDTLPSSLYALRDALRVAGHDVVCVQTPQAAIAQLHATDVDALVTELEFEEPGVGGLAFVYLVRRNAQWRRLPVLALTSRDLLPRSLTVRLGRLGVWAVMCKPVRPDTLRSTLDDAARATTHATAHTREVHAGYSIRVYPAGVAPWEHVQELASESEPTSPHAQAPPPDDLSEYVRRAARGVSVESSWSLPTLDIEAAVRRSADRESPRPRPLPSGPAGGLEGSE